MCGINGFNFNDKSLVQKMNSAISHRGPDDEGVYTDRFVSLGHRRLSIIDLSKKATQPMTYEKGGKKAIIVFNGEIYNFLELKEELKEKGYKFKNHSDTEVILASYFEWGKDCVKRFNGMWAFCIYDLNKKILFLSRDRFGKKPLYYYFDKEKFIFSSEIKGILEHKLNLKIDKDAIDLYLSLGFIPSPYSIYKNLFKVEARQNIFYDLVDKNTKKEYYYSLPKYSPIFDKSALIEEGLELMNKSVKQRLISDVPLGVFLSGGLDSSAITYLMKNSINLKNLNTFSIGFEGEFDESKYAKVISKIFCTRHHHKLFKKEDFDRILKKIFYYYDEPFSDISMFPTYFLSELAKKDVSVCLSGDGGDEVFGGYPRYIRASQIESLRKIPILLRRILFIFSKIFLLRKMKEGIRLSLLPSEEIFSEVREEIYKPLIYKNLMKEKFSCCLKNANGNLVEAFRIMDIYFYTLPDNYLNKVDRASMSNSLEVRSPFLDYRLIEYSFKIPAEWKVSKRKTKILMKEILKDKLPKKIVERRKKGFTPPLANWIGREEYKENVEKYLEELYLKKIIDTNWKKFYNKILDKKDLVSMNYKIRFIMLYHWLKLWEKKINL